ncbi:hypothetical protein VTK26DRAFT_3041 [Humicola hyalothermophila]
MASFPRGLVPRMFLILRQQAPCRCTAALPARLTLRARFFSSSSSRLLQQSIARSSRQAAKKPAPKPAAKPLLPSAPSTQAAPGRPASYAHQLALKGRTLLYESPSHFWFRAGCFSSGFFCVSYTVYQYWTVILHPPEGLYWWIPHAFGVILVFMAGMGAFFIMGAGRLVRSIEAVPVAAVANKALAARAAETQSPILIEVATRRIVPFLPAKKTLLLPDEVQLPMRMFSVFGAGGPMGAAETGMAQRPTSFAERVRRERAEREARIAAHKYTMDHILTAPFRDAAKAFGTAFAGIKRSFNREGFAKIKLGKQTYKLDVSGGWALDNGRAMDRLLPVRPNALR